jgi:hypothetical protein
VSSYDSVKLVVSPSTLNETYQSVKSLVDDVVTKLEDINTTLDNLQLSWVGDSSTLMNEFTQRWQDAMLSLFGSTTGGQLGAFGQLLEGLSSASGNYDTAENWVMTSFLQLANSLMGSGSGSSSGPQNVTNSGSATSPTTFINETF